MEFKIISRKQKPDFTGFCFILQSMKVFIGILCVLLALPSFGQKKESYFQVGVSANSYKGEIGNYDSWSPGIQAGILFNKKKRLNGALNIGFGSLSSEDQTFGFQSNTGTPAPNNFVKTNFLFFNYDLHINIIKKEQLILYLSQGIGFMRFTPKDEFDEVLESQEDTRNEGETYRNLSFILPTSIGIIYFTKRKLGFSFQAGIFNTNTDYLDNISELGDSGNDNALNLRLALLIPLSD
ncbi:hypothetical protein FNH22_03055 [Fulvivirga sp. M361]|uniref:hypothetical protein n=1 Tax=Fulvivirga sp. M361 TaxID=2594266 RepID=UPI00117A0403|nr:hypothetical protein [Fulvivirga sp. M361]TRX61772.1 hypothetical protein FNH22_03055 [Fulvivirga sp. M361]